MQIAGFLALVDQVIGEATTVRARLEHLLLHTYTSIQAKSSQVVLELNNSSGLTKSVIEQRVGLQTHIAQVTERIAALLEDGKRTGELDSTAPTPIMVATFIGLLSLRGYEQLLTSGQCSPAELVTYVSRLFFPTTLAPSSER